jgi:hypothetical protein
MFLEQRAGYDEGTESWRDNGADRIGYELHGEKDYGIVLSRG